MIYIKLFNDVAILGGQETTAEMVDLGWQPYEGIIPQGEHFKLVDGVLEAYVPKPSPPPIEAVYHAFV